MTTIYHNPRCRKSRETLQLLQEKGEQPKIILYLDEVPSEAELQNMIKMLGISPIDLVRKNEAIWKEKFKNKDLSDSEIIAAMAQNPKLIERPIVIKSGRAVLGRPPSNVEDIL